MRKERGRNLASSTLNKYLNVFRKTLKIAMEEVAIASLPPIAMVSRFMDTDLPHLTSDTSCKIGNFWF